MKNQNKTSRNQIWALISSVYLFFLRSRLSARVLTRGVTLLLLITLAFGVFSQTSQAATGINEQLNFQARLLNADGSLVDDGNYNVRFKIYSAGDGDLGGGDETLEWTELHDYNGGAPDNRVRVANGYLTAQLGSITAFGSSVDWNDDTLWLSMDIGGNTTTASYDGELDPFMRLSSVPYALNAANLEGRSADDFVQLDPGATPQAISTANSAVAVNQTGAGNVLQLQASGSDVLTIANSGNATLTGDLAVVSGDITLDNTQKIKFENSGGTALDILRLDSANITSLQTGGNGFEVEDTSNATLFRITETGGATFNGSVTLGDADTDTVTVTGTIQGGSPFIFEGATADAFETTLAVEDPTADITYTLANEAAGTYEICTDSGNCSGVAGGSLQQAYDVGNTLVATDAGGDIDLTVSEEANFSVDITGTGSFLVQDGGTAVLSVIDGGAATFQNTTDSTTGFQVLDSDGGTSILNIDTTNERVGIGTDSPQTLLQVSADTMTLPTISADTVAVFSNINGDNAAISIIADEFGSSSILNFGTELDENEAYIEYWNEDNFLDFYVNGSQGLSIRSDQVLVGGGSNSGYAKLQVTNGSLDITTAPGLASAALFQSNQATINDAFTAASGTATGLSANSFYAPTLTADNTGVTTTDAANVYIQGAPTASTNQTITNSYALFVDDGEVRFDGLVTANADLRISDGSSNYATIGVDALASDYTVDIPTIASNDTFCLQTASNCAGGATTTLQQAYDNGNSILAVDADGDIDLTVSEATNFSLDITGTGSFLVQDGGSDVFGIADGGDITADTDTLFVDASEDRVGIGTTAPDAVLKVLGTAPSANKAAVLEVAATLDSTSDSQSAAYLDVDYSPGSAAGAIFPTALDVDLDSASTNIGTAELTGADVYVTYSGASTTVSELTGVNAITRITGSAGATQSNAQQTLVRNNSSGVLAEARGLSVLSNINGGAGSITDNYGIYVTTQSAGTNDYGVFIQGADTYSLWVNTGTTRLDDDVILGQDATDELNFNGTIQQATPFVFEGATDDANELTLALADPTADITYTFANAAAGTYEICTDAGNCTGVAGGSLQQAYGVGNTIVATNADGDIDLTVSEAANFSVDITGTGSFLVQDGGTNIIEVDNLGDVDINAGSFLTLDSTDTVVIGGIAGTVDIQNAEILNSIGDININDNLEVTGTASIEGALTLGDATTAASIVLQDGDAETITLAIPDIASSYTLTLPTADAAAAGYCLKDTDGLGTLGFVDCSAGASGNDLGEAYLAGTDAVVQLDSTRNEIILRDAATSIGDLFVIENDDSTTNYFHVNATNGVQVGGDFLAGADVELGGDSSNSLEIFAAIRGDISFEGATVDGFDITLEVEDPTANVTYTLANEAAGTYEICTDAGNCSGVAGGSLQQAYGIGNTIAATNADGDIDLTVSEATNFSVDITGTGSFLVQDSGVELLSIADGGAVTFNETGLDADFRIEGDTDNDLFSVDAGNDSISIGTPSSDGKLSLLNSSLNESDNAVYLNSLGLATADGTYDSKGLSIYSISSVSSGITNSGSVFGADIRTDNSLSGTQANAYGVRIDVDASSGTVNNGYGLYIEDTAGTNDFSIYQAAANDVNYFAGNTGIGVIDPSTLLQVDGALTIGNASNTDGTLIFEDASGTNQVTVDTENLTADITYRFANESAGTYEICTDAGNCSGVAGGSLQQAYGIGNTIAATNADGDIDLTVSEATNFSLDITGTGSFLVQDGGTDVLTVVDGGAATFQNFTDSTSAFQILDKDGGTPIFNVDTTNERVGIGNAAPGSLLELSGSTPVLTINDTRDYAPSVGDVLSSIDFTSDDSSSTLTGATRASIAVIQENTFGSAQGLAFYTRDTADYDERVRIDKDGNVGIGTTAPAGILQAVGDEVRIGDAGTVDFATGDGDLYVEDYAEIDGSVTVSGLTTLNGGLTVETGDTFTINGDGFQSLTGTGLEHSSNTLAATLGTDIQGSEIVDGTIEAIDLETTNVASSGTDNYALTYDDATGGFTWVDSGGFGDSKFTDSGAATYLTSTTDTLLVGASTANGGQLESLATSEQLRLSYDASNYTSFSTNINGALYVTPSNGFTNLLSTLVVGDADTENGLIIARGNVTGSVTGGIVRVEAADDHDGTINQYDIRANEDDFEIRQDGSTVLLQANSAEYIAIGDGGTIDVVDGNGDLYVEDELEVDGQVTLADDVQIGSATADSTGTLLKLDLKNTSGDPTGADGAMYYNSDSNKFRCYENSAWTDCISGAGGGGGTTTTATLIPEFAGGVLNADGTNNSGSMTAGYVNALSSGEGEIHNYYSWDTTQSSAQDYDIVVRYQLPDNFDSIGAASTFKFWHEDPDGATTNAQITWSIYDEVDETQCFSTAFNGASAGVWEEESASTLGSCSWSAGDYITMIFNVQTRSADGPINLGEVEFQYDI